MKEGLRRIELQVLSELLIGSKRSDRELAKSLGVSQPTITRIRTRLEKEGYIKRYTIMLDFQRLGYKMMVITFVKVKGTLSPEQREKARMFAKEVLKKGPYEIVMGERGLGMGYDGVFISYHKNYSQYAKLKEWLRQFEFLEVGRTESFIIDLEDSVRYRPLDFASLANNLMTKTEKK